MRLRNMKVILVFVSLVLFFSLLGISSGQVSGPQLDLQLAPNLELAQIVYVSDFDLLQQGALQYLFQLIVDNSTQPDFVGILRFEITLNNDLIAATQTQPFTLSANEVINVSNIDLSQGVIVQSGEEVKFDKGETQSPTSQFEDEVLQSGKLPRGNYKFVVGFLYNSGADESNAPPQILNINNPTFIRPVTPGTTTGSQFMEILYTQFPTFQFETDFDPTFTSREPFRVQIFKKLEQHSSVDEALTSTPHYDEFLFETVFPYPAAAALPLDPGVYVWRVQLEMITSSGTEVMESPVFAFRIEDPNNLGQFANEGLQADLLQILVDLFGEKGKEIARSLSDYNLLAIRLNGEKITREQFYKIIEGYEGQKRKISDIILMGSQQ
jgi:hypothetical protein